MTRRRGLVRPVWRSYVVVAMAVVASRADAQGPPPRPDTLKARMDSIAKVRADSLLKRRADSLARARSDTAPPPQTARPSPDTTTRLKTAADTIRARADSIRKAQLAGLELVNKKIEVDFGQPDSVMGALLEREGYSVTKYQGKSVVFRAAEHVMLLLGRRAAVLRDSALLVGDTITFNDSTQYITARGDTLTLRDPAQGPDDVISLGSIKYDIAARRGVVRDVTTAVESGQRWIVHGGVAAFKGDTTSAGRSAFYASNGWLTSCEEKEPHYHFAAKEMKLISKNVMIVRPAVLYIADVPVAWLPFVFNDMRPGRRSGLLAPTIGFNQVFRSSPFMRREIEDIGYYFAINDYVSSTLSVAWRSDARGTASDPGYVRMKTGFDYRWKDRFIDGQVGLSLQYLKNGQANRTYSVSHNQNFSERTALKATFNYTDNTQIQRQTTFNPTLALQTIQSQANFRTGRGPFSMDVGFTQRQYPGRDQLDRDFPSLRISSKTIEVAPWLTWTPGLSITNSQNFSLDGAADFAYRYFTRPTGGLDSVRIKRDTRNSGITFETPIEIFGFSWRNSFQVTDVANEFPERRTVYPNPRDTSLRQDLIFARTYRTGVEWQTSFSLPNFSQGKFNISPSVTIQKQDPRSPLIVRTERTGGAFVTQGVRPSFGLSMAPKLYGFFRGFGPIERIRHAIEPTVQYAYTPRGRVSDDFLKANGDVAVGFLGNLPQNVVSLGLSTSFEAKLKVPEASASLPPVPSDSGDTTAAVGPGGLSRPVTTQQTEGRKIKLLTMNFTTLTYDFVRAKESSGGTGLTNRTFDFSFRTDLLPGFDFGTNYSLFQGDPISDTAVFKPYREGLRTTIALDANSPIIRGFARLFGIKMADSAARARARSPRQGEGAGGGDFGGRQGLGAGGGNRELIAGRSITRSGLSSSMQIPQGQGWRINLAYTGNRQRPPVGDNVRDYDPRSECDPYRSNPLIYDSCVAKYNTGGIPTTGLPVNSTTRGATAFRYPPQANINGSMSFHVSEKWAAQWQTSYDVTTKEFAQHAVLLKREMHDWDANFAFTRSTNGNFSFNFFIALRAQPDIKFDYDRLSTPRGYSGPRIQ